MIMVASSNVNLPSPSPQSPYSGWMNQSASGQCFVEIISYSSKVMLGSLKNDLPLFDVIEVVNIIVHRYKQKCAKFQKKDLRLVLKGYNLVDTWSQNGRAVSLEFFWGVRLVQTSES